MDKKLVFFAKKYTPKDLRFFLRKARRIVFYSLQSIQGGKTKKKYFCPVNNKHYRIFIKDGNLLLSLGMGARERHRFIWHYLQTQTNLFSTKSIKLLHISPEYSFYKKLKDNKNIQYIPVDKFEPGYDYFSLTKDFDLLDPSLSPEEYDFIICNHVLEHIIDDMTAIANLFKLLKTGGTAIVSVPILANNSPTYEDYSIVSFQERKTHFGQWDHVRYYGVDIEKRFIDAGFIVETVNSTNYLNTDERKKFGVPNDSFLFHLVRK